MKAAPVVLSVLAALLLAAVPPASPETVPEYRVKAEFLERFTRFIEWPPRSGSERPTFVIGVAGQNPFGPYLQQLASERRIKGKPVEIRTITDMAQTDGCDLLFISGSERAHLPAILGITGSKPILTVSDTPGFCAAGVLINFYSANDTVHFEINEAAVEKSGLKLSSKLLKIAKLVEPEAAP